ncbi:MAG: MFS transporter [Usitatibacteraceae bacterium]
MKSPGFLKRQLWLAIAAVLIIVMASIAATVGLMYRAFDSSIAPQVLEKAKTAGRSLSGLIGQAAAYDIPIDELVGVDDLFAASRKKHPEIAQIELLRAGQSTVAVGTAVDAAAHLTARLPIAGYEGARAEIAVSINPGYVRKLFQEMALDLVVVAVVTLFVSLELVYFLAGALVADLGTLRAQGAAMARGAFFPMPQPNWLGLEWSTALDKRAIEISQRYQAALASLRSRWQDRHHIGATSLRTSFAALRETRKRFSFADARQGSRIDGNRNAALALGAMRAPFFLLLLADDLSRSFLPMFASGLPAGPLPLSTNMVASLPIVAFMLVVALSQPLLGAWSERIGRRRSFIGAAALACAAHLLSSQSGSLLELLVWRCAGGGAWAIAFVAAQGYVLDHTDTKTRTAGLAAFVGIIMVSLICGPSIGGILADGVGHRATLALGGALTGVALFLAWRRLPLDQPPAIVTTQSSSPASASKLSIAFANPRFLMLLLLAAVPAKVILIAYCYYLIPLYIVDAGSTSAMAGRMIMLYSVMMVLLVPMMANWVAALRARYANEPEALFVAVGLAVSGVAGLAMALPFGLLSPFIVVLLLGIGQSLSISPQAAMVAEVCKEEIRVLGTSAVYGVYRMVERLGNAAGPLIGAALLELAGFRTAFVAIGVGVVVCAAVFSIVFVFKPTPRHVPRVAQ